MDDVFQGRDQFWRWPIFSSKVQKVKIEWCRHVVVAGLWKYCIQQLCVCVSSPSCKMSGSSCILHVHVTHIYIYIILFMCHVHQIYQKSHCVHNITYIRTVRVYTYIYIYREYMYMCMYIYIYITFHHVIVIIFQVPRKCSSELWFHPALEWDPPTH